MRLSIGQRPAYTRGAPDRDQSYGAVGNVGDNSLAICSIAAPTFAAVAPISPAICLQDFLYARCHSADRSANLVRSRTSTVAVPITAEFHLAESLATSFSTIDCS